MSRNCGPRYREKFFLARFPGQFVSISVQRAVRYNFVRVPGRTLPALQVKIKGTIIDKFYYNYMI